MNRKPVRSYRLSPHTVSQLEALAAGLGTNMSETLAIAIDRMAQQELAQEDTVSKQVAYEVYKDGELQGHDLSEREARKIALEAAKDGQVFVQWFRSSDGMKGYLNRDGNHAITGEAW